MIIVDFYGNNLLGKYTVRPMDAMEKKYWKFHHLDSILFILFIFTNHGTKQVRSLLSSTIQQSV